MQKFQRLLFLPAVFALFFWTRPAVALQVEGGVNYDWDEFTPFFSLDLYPLSLDNPNPDFSDAWYGLCAYFTYESGGFYFAPLFGSAETYSNTTQTIFLGPKFGLNRYWRIGLCLKGTTFAWHVIPFSLIVDPKYDFREKGFVWDFKASVGLGKLLPFNGKKGD